MWITCGIVECWSLWPDGTPAAVVEVEDEVDEDGILLWFAVVECEVVPIDDVVDIVVIIGWLWWWEVLVIVVWCPPAVDEEEDDGDGDGGGIMCVVVGAGLVCGWFTLAELVSCTVGTG